MQSKDTSENVETCLIFHETNHHVMLDDSEGVCDFNEEVESHYIKDSLDMLGEIKSSKNLEGQNQT